jgi:ribonuclease BN (tRNA processing enzyme)
LASQARAKKVALFHHSPDSDDAALVRMLQVGEEYSAKFLSNAQTQTAPRKIFIAREGATVEL